MVDLCKANPYNEGSAQSPQIFAVILLCHSPNDSPMGLMERGGRVKQANT